MTRLFEIGWWGGAAERRFRRLRPRIDDLPWGTLDPSRYPVELLDRARVHWTQNAVSEYRAAAAFAELLRDALQAHAPLDLVGMASDFVTDELVHTELASRVAMELGGGAPIALDDATLTGVPDRGHLSARRRANAAVVRVGCVFETFSKVVLAETRAAPLHPLIHAVITLIARDEARHARFAWHYLEWAHDDLDAEERADLARVAEQAIQELGVTAPASPPDPQRIELGLVGVGDFAERARRTVARNIVAPLARFGICASMDPGLPPGAG